MTESRLSAERQDATNGAERLAAALGELVGKPVWDVSPPKPNLGSTFILFIGEPIPRSSPSPGSSEGSPLRMNDWEYSVFAWDPWRIETATDVVCTWMDDRSKGGISDRILSTLIGSHIVRVTAGRPAFDLTIEFSDGKRLLVFNGTAHEDSDEGSWDLSTPDQEFEVSGGGRINVEPRASLLR